MDGGRSCGQKEREEGAEEGSDLFPVHCGSWWWSPQGSLWALAMRISSRERANRSPRTLLQAPACVHIRSAHPCTRVGVRARLHAWPNGRSAGHHFPEGLQLYFTSERGGTKNPDSISFTQLWSLNHSNFLTFFFLAFSRSSMVSQWLALSPRGKRDLRLQGICMDFLPPFQRHSSLVDLRANIPLSYECERDWIPVCVGQSLTDVFTLPEVLSVFTGVHKLGSIGLRELKRT